LVAGFSPLHPAFDARSDNIKFVVDIEALGLVFSEYLPDLIPDYSPPAPYIIRGWYSKPLVADVASGLRLTPFPIN
jgi:hypothetical protein